MRIIFALFGLVLSAPAFAAPQANELLTPSWTAEYRVITDGTTALMENVAVDVYLRRTANAPVAVWWSMEIRGRESRFLRVLPLLEMGLNVVVVHSDDDKISFSRGLLTNVDAVRRIGDGRCVRRWLGAVGKSYGFDTRRVIMAGTSIEAYTALMTGVVRSDAGFDGACPWTGDDITVGAIVNFFGPSRPSAIADTVPAQLQPATYFDKNQPPVLAIHGDADAVVPVASAREIDRTIAAAGGVHDLLLIPGAVHGLENWNSDQLNAAWAGVREFLALHDFLP